MTFVSSILTDKPLFHIIYVILFNTQSNTCQKAPWAGYRRQSHFLTLSLAFQANLHKVHNCFPADKRSHPLNPSYPRFVNSVLIVAFNDLSFPPDLPIQRDIISRSSGHQAVALITTRSTRQSALIHVAKTTERHRTTSVSATHLLFRLYEIFPVVFFDVAVA